MAVRTPLNSILPKCTCFLGCSSRPVSRGTRKKLSTGALKPLHSIYNTTTDYPILTYIYAFRNCVSRETAPLFSTNTIHTYMTTLKFSICKRKKRNIRTFRHNRRAKTPLKKERTQIWPFESSKSADVLGKSTQITTNYRECNRITRNLLRKRWLQHNLWENFNTLEIIIRHKIPRSTCLVDTFGRNCSPSNLIRSNTAERSSVCHNNFKPKIPQTHFCHILVQW